ncbi:hypothetical protein DVH29_10660 [Pelagibacterium lacus]|uniref:Uncharacterized protein n=1 Tax=Pelagibacterium lacus TaxID=2282655 RepID=A0A369W411_9HYPH|nr:hypothetical protein DVH29_10660 [Pelagibacterium lacus]
MALTILVAACGSSHVASAPQLNQELEIKCVASNARPSGCTTSHTIAVSTTITRTDGTLPSAADLRPPQAGESEF